MTFQPYPTRSGFVFLGAAFLFAAGAIFLIRLVAQQSDWTRTFQFIVILLIALSITAVSLYWAMIAFRFHYQLNRNGLAIQWGLAQQRVPFESIKTVISGQQIDGLSWFKGVKVAGFQVGRGEVSGYGPVKIRTTAGLSHSLLVVTSDQSYLISPRQPDDFFKAWQVRQPLGPTQRWSTGTYRSWPLNSPILTDPLTWWLLGTAVLIYLALFGYLSVIFADLPSALPIHFNALGQADRIADKSALLTLPAAGAIVLGLNAVLGSVIYGREKIAAYLLWGSAIIMQLFLWIAVLTITT